MGSPSWSRMVSRNVSGEVQYTSSYRSYAWTLVLSSPNTWAYRVVSRYGSTVAHRLAPGTDHRPAHHCPAPALGGLGRPEVPPEEPAQGLGAVVVLLQRGLGRGPHRLLPGVGVPVVQHLPDELHAPAVDEQLGLPLRRRVALGRRVESEVPPDQVESPLQRPARVQPLPRAEHLRQNRALPWLRRVGVELRGVPGKRPLREVPGDLVD